MSRKARHNGKVRARILAAASGVFCSSGYCGASIKRIVGAAGLTRGAFYAHFGSKAALFGAVLREGDPVTRALRERSGQVQGALWIGFRHILRACLDPERGARLRQDWVLPVLLREVDAVGQGARAAWTDGIDDLVTEAMRGAPSGVARDALHEALMGVLAAVSGAHGMGRAANPLLHEAGEAFGRKLDAWTDPAPGTTGSVPDRVPVRLLEHVEDDRARMNLGLVNRA